MPDPTHDDTATSVYVTRIQQTRMPGYNHVWFRCSGCDLQGDMTGTNDETDEVLAVLGAAHDDRHGRTSTSPVAADPSHKSGETA